jgi:hypothetical protein
MPFPVQARRLFPSCSVEEVPMTNLTGLIRPATLPAADDEPLTRRPHGRQEEIHQSAAQPVSDV